MSYRLNNHEAVPDGITRVVLEQMDIILHAAQATRGNQDDAVHDARTSLKKIRALLRLVRGDINGDVFTQENLCFRDAGRHLAAVRDAAVMLETFDKLVDHFSGQLTVETFTELRNVLRQSNAIPRAEKQKALAMAAKMIGAARRRVEHWPINHDGFSPLRPGIERAYKRGCRSLAQAVDQPSVENFHEWRKQVKCLWYQIRFLKPIWPKMMKPVADELKALGEYLSDDHDLAILRARVFEQAKPLDDRTALEALVALIDQRRGELEAEAKPLGARLYAEKPGAFVDRLQVYWHVWRAEVRVEPIAVS
jgi:CHAD domain-containing protein